MRATLAALALVFSVAACSDLTGPGSLTGTYDLRSVNGQGLPYTVDQSALYRLDLAGSSLTLHRDGTYTTTFLWRETIRGSTTTDTEHFEGTYSRSGDEIYLYDDFDGSTTIAYVEGSRVVIESEDLTFEYR
jgi:hypothetical protein